MAKKTKITFNPARSEDWLCFMRKTAQLDKRHKKPYGWHWFWGLYYLQEHFSPNTPRFDLKRGTDTFPDGHWLKIAEQDSYVELADGGVQYRAPKDREEEHKLVKFWVKCFTIADKGEITKITFSNRGFGDSKNFSNLIFLLDTDFSKARFSNNVFFEKAVFLETVNFENATFHKGSRTNKETAKFKDAVFMKTADFSKTVFDAYANFKGATFCGRIIFQQAKFKCHAPRFYGTTFNNEIILNRVELPEAKIDKLPKITEEDDNNTDSTDDTDNDIYQKTVEENKSAYETLIYLMEKQNKHHDRHRFFREEMRWRQLGNILTRKRRRMESLRWRIVKPQQRRMADPKNWYITKPKKLSIAGLRKRFRTKARKQRISEAHNYLAKKYSFWERLEDNFTITFFWLYEKITDYGYDIGRTFVWWLGHICFWTVWLFICVFYDKGFSKGLGCSFITSITNAHSFLLSKGTSTTSCYNADSTTFAFNFIWTLEAISGAVFLSLLLITLRVRFRLK